MTTTQMFVVGMVAGMVFLAVVVLVFLGITSRTPKDAKRQCTNCWQWSAIDDGPCRSCGDAMNVFFSRGLKQR